jgi:hypothetical protein
MRRARGTWSLASLPVLALALALSGCEDSSRKTVVDDGFVAPPRAEPPPPTGGELEDAEGRFSLTLPPIHPQPTVSREPIEEGRVELVRHVSRLPDRGLMISWCDYPPALFAVFEDPSGILNVSRQGALQQMGAEVLREERADRDGHFVRSTWFRSERDGVVALGRLDEHARPPRVYMMRYVTTTEGVLEEPGVIEAFETFRCWPPSAGIEVRPEGGGYALTLPLGYPAPIAEEASIDTDAGAVLLRRQGSGGHLGTFWTSTGDWLTESEASPPARLEAALAALLSLQDAEPSSKPGEISLGAWPGLEVRFQGPLPNQAAGRVHGRLAVYLVEGRLISVLFVSPQINRNQHPEVEAAFAGLELR